MPMIAPAKSTWQTVIKLLEVAKASNAPTSLDPLACVEIDL